MRTRLIAAAAATAIALTVAPGAKAQTRGCNYEGIGGALGKPAAMPSQLVPLTIAAGPETIYVEVRGIAGKKSDYSAWFYRESNKITGLQHGHSNKLLKDNDPASLEQEEQGCEDGKWVQQKNGKKVWKRYPPDTLIF